MMKNMSEYQNSKEMLQIQYAARWCYNHSESLFYITCLLCICSIIAGVLFDAIVPNEYLYIGVGLIALCDVLAFVLNIQFNRYIDRSADLRCLFDYAIFDFGKPENILDSREKELKEYAIKLSRKHPNEYKVQIKNTGSDCPPGVRDWYIIQEGLSFEDTIFECQRQNRWWDKKMTNVTISLILSSLIVALIIVISILRANGSTQIVAIIAGGLPLILVIFDYVKNSYKSLRLSIELQTLVDRFASLKAGKGVREIQNVIDQRRKLPLVNMNLIHKTSASTLTRLYSETNSD